MNWWAIGIAWVFVGFLIHRSLRLTFMTIWNKLDPNGEKSEMVAADLEAYFPIGGAKMKRAEAEAELGELPEETKEGKWVSVFSRPGTHIATDFFYFLYVVTLWPYAFFPRVRLSSAACSGSWTSGKSG